MKRNGQHHDRLHLADSSDRRRTGRNDLLKYTEGFSRLWPSLGCVVAYVFCFYALSKALHYMPLSIAYATWCALGIVAATLLSVLLFREQLTLTGIASITLVVAGVVILNLWGGASH